MCGVGSFTYRPTLEFASNKNANTAAAPGQLPKGYADYYGTFKDDKFHGLGYQIWPGCTYEGEYKEGKRHGKFTCYRSDGTVHNFLYENGKPCRNENWDFAVVQICNPNLAWYGDGKPRLVENAYSDFDDDSSLNSSSKSSSEEEDEDGPGWLKNCDVKIRFAQGKPTRHYDFNYHCALFGMEGDFWPE